MQYHEKEIEKNKIALHLLSIGMFVSTLISFALKGQNVTLDGMLCLWQNPNWSTWANLSQSKRTLRSNRFLSSSVQKPGTPVSTVDALPQLVTMVTNPPPPFCGHRQLNIQSVSSNQSRGWPHLTFNTAVMSLWKSFKNASNRPDSTQRLEQSASTISYLCLNDYCLASFVSLFYSSRAWYRGCFHVVSVYLTSVRVDVNSSPQVEAEQVELIA